jgi:hypothetical protein
MNEYFVIGTDGSGKSFQAADMIINPLGMLILVDRDKEPIVTYNSSAWASCVLSGEKSAKILAFQK